MTADRLREAARVLRERAEAADNGPWKSDSSIEGDTIVYPATGGWLSNVTSPRVYEGGVVCFDHERANGDYIATMHPGVGLALADLIDKAASQLEQHLPHWRGERWEADHHPADDPPPPGYKDPEWVSRTVQHHYGDWFQLADQILGSTP